MLFPCVAIWLLIVLPLSEASSPPLCPLYDTSLSPQQRARLVASAMTTDQLISQLTMWQPAFNVTVSGAQCTLSGYSSYSEALHGLFVMFPANNNNAMISPPDATAFPQVIGLAAAFNVSLWRRVARTIAVETRAHYNFYKGQGLEVGTTIYAPNINCIVDGRHGRAQETAGEDSLVVARYASNFIRGAQGEGDDADDPRYVLATSTAKHYMAYAGPETFVVGGLVNCTRYSFSANVSGRDLDTYYTSAFAAAVEANVGSVMSSYNAVNGIPMAMNNDAVNGILRGRLGFDGNVISDAQSIAMISIPPPQGHGYIGDVVVAAAAALRAGTDSDLGFSYKKTLGPALQRSLISRSDLETAFVRLLVMRLRQGEFDLSSNSVYNTYMPATHSATAAHHALAIEAAQQSMVLLKNSPETRALPLNAAKITTLALIGPHFNTTPAGDYTNYAMSTSDTLYSALQRRFSTLSAVMAIQGCAISGADTSQFAAAAAIAKKADVVVVAIGIDGTLEGETLDRTDMNLPLVQTKLLATLRQATTARIVCVLFNGGAVWLDATPCDALLEAFYPAQFTGTAVSSVLFGDVSPSGRLPYTVYQSNYALVAPSILDYSLTKAPGKTYRFYKSPVYEFGFGMSYTTFSIVINRTSTAPLRVTVTNTGAFSSAETLIVFAVPSPLSTTTSTPLRQVVDFVKTKQLSAGQFETLQLDLIALPEWSASLSVCGSARNCVSCSDCIAFA